MHLSNNLGSWIITNPSFGTSNNFEYTLEKVYDSIQKVDLWLSDLDDTDTTSPAKAVAKHAIGTSYKDINFLRWIGYAGMEKIFNPAEFETNAWKRYVEMFLSSPEGKEAASQYINSDFVQEHSFPKVKEFYRSFPAKKVYLTRNIDEIVKPYQEEFGFEHSITQSYNKVQAFVIFAKYNLKNVNVGFIGDSTEDAVVAECINAMKNTYFKDAISIRVNSSEESIMEESPFDLEISQDRSFLYYILERGNCPSYVKSKRDD